MYKSEVKHQYGIRHSQCDGDKKNFSKSPANIFHIPVMFTDYFPMSGCVTELAEYGGQKAEQHYDDKDDNPTEKAKHQRYSKRYGYGKQPA